MIAGAVAADSQMPPGTLFGQRSGEDMDSGVGIGWGPVTRTSRPGEPTTEGRRGAAL